MRLFLMARAPIPGQTKTRLQTHLTPFECAELHTCFIKDMLRMTKEGSFGRTLAFTPPEKKGLLQEITGSTILLIEQKGKDLGEKMLNLINLGLAEGAPSVGVIGTDLPHTKLDILILAQEFLEGPEQKDIVLGPTPDGGYYFIGMKNLIPEVFKEINWGSGKVWEQTIEIINALDLQLGILPTLNDIDTFEDLLELYNSLSNQGDVIYRPSETINYLRTLNLKERSK